MGLTDSFNAAVRNQTNFKPFNPDGLQGRKRNGDDDTAPAKRTVKALDVSKIARARKNISAPDASKIKRNDKNDNGKK